MYIIITGASSGIGYHTAKSICEYTNCKKEDITLLLLARSYNKLEQLQSEILSQYSHVKVIIEQFDISKDNINNIIIKNNITKVDKLLHNAGLLINKPFEEYSDEEIENIFYTNIIGVIKMTRNLIPYLNIGSHVLNISSMGGFQGSVKFPGLSIYSASKGALNILTESLASEYTQTKGIIFNSLSLGSVRTSMLSEAFPGYSGGIKVEDMGKEVARMLLMGQAIYNGKLIPMSKSTP